MKREVEREVRLPAFALHIGEFELLWMLTQQLLDEASARRESINLSLPRERLQFDSFDELKGYGHLRGRVTNFSFSISQGGNSVNVSTGGFFSNTPTLKVQGSTDVWCAGAIEAVMSVVIRNRLWYWWLVRVPLMLTFFLIAMIPYLYNWTFSKQIAMPAPVALAYVSILFMLGFIAFTREKLLPAAALVFTTELGFIRRYGAELGLALGLLSFVAAILMWLFPRGA